MNVLQINPNACNFHELNQQHPSPLIYHFLLLLSDESPLRSLDFLETFEHFDLVTTIEFGYFLFSPQKYDPGSKVKVKVKRSHTADT